MPPQIRQDKQSFEEAWLRFDCFSWWSCLGLVSDCMVQVTTASFKCVDPFVNQYL